MMSVLVAAVVFFGGLTLLNLALTGAAIRHIRRLDQRGQSDQAGSLLPAVGSEVPAYSVRTLTGERLSHLDIGLLVVLTPSCAPCRTLASRLVEDESVRAEQPLVLIAGGGDAEATAQLVELLAGTVRVAHDDDRITEKLGVHGFPAVVRTSATGHVLAASHNIDDILGAAVRVGAAAP